MTLNATVKVLITLLCIATVSGNCFAADLTAVPTFETCPDPGNKGGSADNLPGKIIKKSAVVSPLDGGPIMPSLTYRYKKVDYNLAQFLRITKVAGFVVLHRGKVVKEVYCDGYSEGSRLNFQSVTKSIVSTLIAIMIKEHPGYTLDTWAGNVADALKGSAYNKVPLRAILQMSSGAEFADDGNMSGPFGFFAQLTRGASLEAKVKAQRSVRKYGTVFQYSGIDTTALGMILSAGTGKSNADYLEEKIWGPLGMQASAEWKTDKSSKRRELAFCCLYATLRDIARFGKLMADDGVWNGTRLLPRGWVRQATHPDSPHLMPEDGGTGYSIGYQYQWWTEPNPPDAFYGMGIYGQNLYIDPQAKVVVVIASKWPKAEVDEYYGHTYKFMRAISQYYRGK